MIFGTYRTERNLHLLHRLHMENHSYRAQWKTGEFVVTPDGGVGIVSPKTQYEDNPLTGEHDIHYYVKVGEEPGQTHLDEYWGEGRFRKPNWGEYIHHRNPETGRMDVGLTPSWGAWTIHGAVIFACIWWQRGSGVFPDPAALLPLIVIGAFWVLTYGNYRAMRKGKQM